MDCRDCQHLNPQFMWCEEHRKEIEKPWEEEACKDFVPCLWELDYTTKLRLKKALDISYPIEKNSRRLGL